MEKLTSVRRATLLSAGAISIILGACTTSESSANSSKTPVEQGSCTYTTVNVLPTDSSGIKVQVIAPGRHERWKNRYAFSIIGDSVEVNQLNSNDQVDSITNPVQTKTFKVESDTGVSFTDQNPEIIVHASIDQNQITTPKVPINLSFCPPSTI